MGGENILVQAHVGGAAEAALKRRQWQVGSSRRTVVVQSRRKKGGKGERSRVEVKSVCRCEKRMVEDEEEE